MLVNYMIFLKDLIMIFCMKYESMVSITSHHDVEDNFSPLNSFTDIVDLFSGRRLNVSSFMKTCDFSSSAGRPDSEQQKATAAKRQSAQTCQTAMTSVPKGWGGGQNPTACEEKKPCDHMFVYMSMLDRTIFYDEYTQSLIPVVVNTAGVISSLNREPATHNTAVN